MYIQSVYLNYYIMKRKRNFAVLKACLFPQMCD